MNEDGWSLKDARICEQKEHGFCYYPSDIEILHKKLIADIQME
ncbi:unnamed protein product, partial [marine sediment metagenome]